MTASEYAAVELSNWQQALAEQREAERELDAVCRHGPRQRAFELLAYVRALRIRADLWLAKAVEVKCKFRHDATTVAKTST